MLNQSRIDVESMPNRLLRRGGRGGVGTLGGQGYLWPEGRNPRVGTPSGGIRENGAS